ncbi:hypothetical protein [Ferruginibacter sp. HRS2-29]|uniref:hypothetical protein n=1 Tax=Ferruginibacter sp. HRS2-29 TaxID=2487334 RepID=UPI0020CE73A9|nr:hypothetical protein [Ferruginibacter sp. HRS2-29]MCP9749544.1 hypothetical protein [Ferruginibacter sp. HRS2-29]
MKNQPDQQSPEEKRKDTSAPGREEEVIVNTQEQMHVTNMQDETDLPSEDDASFSKKQETKGNPGQAERTFKEGLGNNSDTEASE